MLFNIGRGVKNTFVPPATPSLWQRLKELNIAKCTRRGYRGGVMRKRLPIPVIITGRSPPNIDSTIKKSASLHNLAQVPINHNQGNNIINVPVLKPAPNAIKKNSLTNFAVWNARSVNKRLRPYVT